MNQQKTHQTNQMRHGIPWVDAPSDPLGPPGPSNGPPRNPKQVSWPHRTPKITLTALQIIEDPSNVAVDPTGHLTSPLL